MGPHVLRVGACSWGGVSFGVCAHTCVHMHVVTAAELRTVGASRLRVPWPSELLSPRNHHVPLRCVPAPAFGTDPDTVPRPTPMAPLCLGSPPSWASIPN